jgi:LemA protein
MSLFVIIVLALVLGYCIIAQYNKIVKLQEETVNSKKQIDVQLDRRYKVFESLINTVKEVMDFEKSTLKEVVALRNQAISARKEGNDKEVIEAEEKISNIANHISVINEQYPQLRSMENVQQLQEEIVSTENKLSFAKQGYNDAVAQYNSIKRSFFGGMLVSLFGSLNSHYEYWGISNEKAVELEEYKVNFNK